MADHVIRCGAGTCHFNDPSLSGLKVWIRLQPLNENCSSLMETDPLFCGTGARNALGSWETPFAHPISRYWIQRILDRPPTPGAPLLRM